MLELARFAVVAGLLLVMAQLALLVLSVARHRAVSTVRDRVAVGVGHPGPGGPGPDVASAPEARGVAGAADLVGQLAAGVLTIAVVTRGVALGHGPFSNQYEFAVSFSWGMVVATAVARRRFAMPMVSLATLPVALAMLLYAMTLDSGPRPLVPALENTWLLTVHVLAAVLAYGAAAVSCGAAALLLIGLRRRVDSAQTARLDEIAYRSVVVAYPLLTVMLVLGAVWADIAWGTYWSWDPKETSALMTWLLYGGYLHARVVKGWRGQRAALLLLVAFASVLFTFFGNLFLGGLHSYA